MSEILVGVDGSEQSRMALRWAAGSRQAQGSTLRAVTAWQYPAGAGTPAGATALRSAEEMDRNALRDLERTISEVLGEKGGDVRAEVGRGAPGDVLLQRAAAPSVDGLVLGARGLGGFEGMLLGSVTQRCVENAPCPVVVVRGDAVVIPPSRLVVGLDGSDGSRRALDWTIDLARGAGAEVVAVHALGIDATGEDRRRAEEQVRGEWSEPLRAAGVSHTVHVEWVDPRTALIAAAKEDADLVVVGRRGLGPIRSLLLGSVSGYLVRYAEQPIAVVPTS